MHCVSDEVDDRLLEPVTVYERWRFAVEVQFAMNLSRDFPCRCDDLGVFLGLLKFNYPSKPDFLSAFLWGDKNYQTFTEQVQNHTKMNLSKDLFCKF